MCSDILDMSGTSGSSAELIQDNLREDSQYSQNDEEDGWISDILALRDIREGEEMNNEIANFIGIHMLNDSYIEDEELQDKNE